MEESDVRDVLDVYEVKLLELAPAEASQVRQLVASMQDLCKKTGKQGRIASGLFAFNILLEHFIDDQGPDTPE